MRILFVNHAFPGTFGALAAAFAAAGHEVLFASGFRRRDFSLSGVRHVTLAPSKEGRAAGASRHVPGLETALSVGGQALRAFNRLGDMGLVPDMALLSANDGYGLFCAEAFPQAFCVGWAGAPVSLPGAEVLGEVGFARHLLHCRYALCCHAFVCLGTGERSLFASRLSHGLDAPCTVNTDWFSPSAGTGPEVVLFHTGRQGAQTVLPVVAGLLEARGRCHVAVLCEGHAAWESWSAAHATLPHKARLHLPGTLALEEYRDLLRTAALLICPNDGGLPASMLLEAMSSGVVPVLEAGTGPDFLQDGQNAMCFRGDGENRAAFLAALLEARTPLAAAQAGARATVQAHFDSKTVTVQHVRLLLNAYEAWKAREHRA